MFIYKYFYIKLGEGNWYLCELNLLTKQIKLLEVRN